LPGKDIRRNEGKTEDRRQVTAGFISYPGHNKRDVIHLLAHGQSVSAGVPGSVFQVLKQKDSGFVTSFPFTIP